MNKIFSDILCRRYKIKNYTYTENGIIVNGDVSLSNKNLYEIPINFKEVYGSFDVSQNPNLNTHKNFPQSCKQLYLYGTKIEQSNLMFLRYISGCTEVFLSENLLVHSNRFYVPNKNNDGDYIKYHYLT